MVACLGRVRGCRGQAGGARLASAHGGWVTSWLAATPHGAGWAGGRCGQAVRAGSTRWLRYRMAAARRRSLMAVVENTAQTRSLRCVLHTVIVKRRLAAGSPLRQHPSSLASLDGLPVLLVAFSQPGAVGQGGCAEHGTELTSALRSASPASACGAWREAATSRRQHRHPPHSPRWLARPFRHTRCRPPWFHLACLGLAHGEDSAGSAGSQLAGFLGFCAVRLSSRQTAFCAGADGSMCCLACLARRS